MAKFSFIAKDKSAKTVKGFIEAVNEERAAKILRKRNLVPIKIFLSKESILREITKRIFQRISLAEVANFTRNISTMIIAGLPLTDALIIIKNQASPKMRMTIEDILVQVEGGSTLADSLARHPEIFSKVYIALIKAGESAGVLDRTMSRLADNLEKQREFQGKVKGAMIYPIIIICGMGIVGLIMMLVVIPKLMNLYAEFGAQLPTPTKILIFISTFLTRNLPLLVLISAGAFCFLRLFQKTPLGRKKIDNFKLKIPLLGGLQKQIILTEICRTLGLLVGSGIQIVDALNIVAGASNNLVFEEGIKTAAKQVEKGIPLAATLSQNENFPPIMPQLLSVGEETGKLDEVLGKLSHYFETESDQMLKGLTTAVEPLIMILLGIGVGFLIIAIILPIYNLTTQF